MNSPHRICSADAIGYPLIDPVEALRARVACEHPEKGVLKSEFEKICPSSRDECRSDPPAPTFRIYIKRAQLAMVRQIGLPRWRGSGESDDLFLFGRDNRPGLQGVSRLKIIRRRSILGAQPVEVIVRKKFPIGYLPGPNVHPCDCECILRRGRPKQHAKLCHDLPT